MTPTASFPRPVVEVARRHLRRWLSLSPALHRFEDDLQQELLIAAWRAWKDFDPKRGVKFSTFSWGLMRGAALSFLKREKRAPLLATDFETHRLDSSTETQVDRRSLLALKRDSSTETKVDARREVNRLARELKTEFESYGERAGRQRADGRGVERDVELYLRVEVLEQSQADAARAVGVSRQRVHQVLSQLKSARDEAQQRQQKERAKELN